MEVNELDKWSAEACGVLVDSYGSEGSPIAWKQTGAEYDWIEGYWTLSDARCMEIFFDWWLNDSPNLRRITWDGIEFKCQELFSAEYETLFSSMFENPKMACAQAIMEASK